MSDLSNPSDASNAPVLLHPGDTVRIKATGKLASVICHELDRGAVTYRVEHSSGECESGFLVKELERVQRSPTTQQRPRNSI